MKLKFTLCLMAVILFAVACSKERTCECTTLETTETIAPNGIVTKNVSTPVVQKTIYKDAKKSELKTGENCGNVTFTGSSNISSASSTSGSRTSYTTEVKCSIQ